MEFDSQYDERLVRYLLHESSLEEEQEVTKWIEESENNLLYLQHLENTLQLFSINEENKKIDLEQEWKKFGNLKMATDQQVYHIQSEAAEYEDRQQSSLNQRTFRLWTSMAVAASVLLAVVLIWNTWKGTQTGKEMADKQSSTADKIDPMMAIMVHEINTTSSTRTLRFPDGSQVILFPGSNVTYREPSERNKREVLLKGKADFKVAKDKSKPFTVFSGDISTTALGTHFLVTTTDKQITVRLTEGKVVVKPLKIQYPMHMKNMFLLPGQELVYDVLKGTALIRSFGTRELAIKKEVPGITENPSIPKYGKKSWFMFNNQPLSEIFNALEGMYGVRIIYSKKEVQNMYFIGTFDKSDSVEYILKQIASINNLDVRKDSNSFRLQKKK